MHDSMAWSSRRIILFWSFQWALGFNHTICKFDHPLYVVDAGQASKPLIAAIYERFYNLGKSEICI
jgi:hypothetical protein